MRSSKPITVTLGSQQKSLEGRLQSGAYSSASEVIRAALRALDREEDAIDEIMRLKIREAIEDPGSDIDSDVVFERLERLHAERMKAEDGGA
ncbi:type II toxin-antitoxin system ParD family antitoxin [Rhizobium brockwellii]|uniref:type II toxin-antitoxin system ParD family antitoxin n=1 Tax=Rhizobium brockwellii TaxID=3019932 RepID=UPI0005230923|nr:type II toxin-antitoxin system ParD family antitoxin [Rhizobium brockwellii]KPN26122.1 CopG family transcriptional regulator [Rhizobium brockwellii]QJX04068.1 type II toxin-antitoxin system ParD family antitoxin [Rhizobium brockwellii]